MWTGASESVCKVGASLPKSTGRLCNSVRLVGDERYLHRQGAESTLTKEAIFHGVRCGIIHPGFTDTPMARAGPGRPVPSALSWPPPGASRTPSALSSAPSKPASPPRPLPRSPPRPLPRSPPPHRGLPPRRASPIPAAGAACAGSAEAQRRRAPHPVAAAAAVAQPWATAIPRQSATARRYRSRRPSTRTAAARRSSPPPAGPPGTTQARALERALEGALAGPSSHCPCRPSHGRLRRVEPWRAKACRRCRQPLARRRPPRRPRRSTPS